MAPPRLQLMFATGGEKYETVVELPVVAPLFVKPLKLVATAFATEWRALANKVGAAQQ